MNKTDNTLIPLIVEALQDKRGHKITTIDLSAIPTANATHYVVATGNTPTQVAALADNVREQVQRLTGRKPDNYDGYRNSTWIALDYGEAMVHIFVPEARAFYDIEQLWADGVINNVPDID